MKKCGSLLERVQGGKKMIVEDLRNFFKTVILMFFQTIFAFTQCEDIYYTKMLKLCEV